MAKQAVAHPEEFRVINSVGAYRNVSREEFEARLVSPWADVLANASWENLAGGRPGWVYYIGGEA